MGFNIAGIAINKNFQNDFESLQKKLGWKLKKVAQVSFEEASSNWKEDGIYDVYFSDHGTLIFTSMDMGVVGSASSDLNILTFAISETSSAYNLIYTESGFEKRSVMIVDEQIINDSVVKLEVEKDSKHISETIWNQLSEVMSKRFWSIEPNEIAHRYIVA